MLEVLSGAETEVQVSRFRNRLLDKVRPSDWGLIGPHLEPVTLKDHEGIEVPTKPISHAYFLEFGIASVVAVDGQDHRIEIGVIGYEGVTGVPLIMGDNRAQHSTYIQIGGSGHRISADALRAAIAESHALRALFLKWALAFTSQTAYTALANGRATLQQRLARWLLMAHDRVTGDEIPLTHEFLSVMLGVRRAGVTVAIRDFDRRGLVTTQRGKLTVRDRVAIKQAAGSFYGKPEAELERLLDGE